MGCVNTSSREFKQLAKKSNVSSNTLELIVHKYWLETGSEENFPSDVYIQAQLGNTKYAEGLSSVIKLWNKRYSTPIICKSLEELNRRKAEAMRFFPGSSIVHYKNAKGDYVLNIKEPVEKANYIAPDYFQTDYPSNTKKLNLNIKEDKSYDIKTAQQLFNRFNTDSTNKAFAEKVFEVANNLGLRIVFTNSLPASSLGRYINNNTISFKRDFFERDWNNDAKAPIILHEVLHALTMYAISPQMQGIAKPQALEEFNTEINSLFLDIQSLPELEGERGIVNVNEFIAELSNPIFRNKLKNIKTEKSLWQRIVDAVMKLFGFTPKNQYYNRAMNALDEALNAFDVDTYMIYNGMKKTLKGGYEYARDENANASAKEVRQHVEESIVEKLPEGDNRIITKNPRLTVEEKKSLDRLKPKYRGKLIYAQAGTGKTAIADNVAIFDSDYLLGEVLGTSAATAGFFFRTMSRAQKQAFGETYRDLIKRKVEEGKTVLTANASLLDDADVVVYNQSAEQTDARVNSSDRAITNKYSALNYHEATLEHINQLQQDEKNKEYIKLDSDDYLGNHILSNNNSSLDIYGKANQQKSDTRLRSGVSSLNTINNFLNEFGISVNHLSGYNNDVPLFDALNRVINVKSVDEITDGVGYAVAFMMQSDPEMQKIILAAHNLRGTYNTKIRDPRKKFKVKTPLGQMTRLLVLKDDTIREVGKQIAQQLREYFGEDINKVKPSEKNESVWKIIKRFFKKLATNVVGAVISKGKIKGIKSEARATKELFIKDIIEALGREDFSRIKGPMIKPGSKEVKAQRVFIEKALRENPFEEEIITKLGSKGVALAGSAAIALDGTLFRPAENPLHDIDFNAPDKSSRKFMDKVMSELFDEGTWAFSTSIPNMVDRKKSTQTYVVLNQPFVTKDVRAKGFFAKYYTPDGKYLGERIKSDLKLEPGVQGKLLDFFVGPENESEYGFHKKTLNGKEYLIADSKYALAAKILWARPKDMWDYKNFRRDNRTENLLNQLDWFDSLPEKELQAQINSIKIEHADYEFLNSEAPKESDNKFVFNDGTVVDAPFKLNDQQADALNEMSDFIESDENTMTLSGYAGTGKTSIMEMLANKVRKQHRRIVFTATTNKASSVLKSKVSKSGFNASTLHKAIGISLEVNENSEYDADDLVQNINESQIIGPGDIVVIDEASMIDEHLYETINQVANDMRLKIIYVGDEAQLAPVNEDKISKVFRNHNGKIVRLTKVERTDDNAILKEATALRNGEPLSRVSSFNDEGKGVAYVKPENKKVLSDLVKYYAPKLKENPDYFRVLAYTNAAVAKYNTAVRNILGYTTPKPHKGEPMVGYTNWGYDWRTKTYKFVNSESYKVSRVGKDTVRTIRVGNHYEKLTVTPISLMDSFGEENSFYYVDVKSNPENKKTALIIAEEIQALWQKVRTLNRKDRGPVFREINTLEEALFVNDDVTDPTRKRNGKPVRIIKKVVDFGYALTTHKSQGSTFTHVLIDDIDISKASSNHNNFYEAVDIEGLDAEENVDFSNAEMIGEGEEIDFGFDIDELETPKSEESTITESTNPEQADTRQQLRYVGVSRATDTVTIISNNVKTEDSPLNHIPGKENSNEKETPVQEETPSKGENISSKGSEFAKKLTNIGNDLKVTFRGKEFRNAEHAYQTWKSGTFDETAYNNTSYKPVGTKPANKASNYHTMVEILQAKLRQHPELIEGIDERGGLEYLKNSTHVVIGDPYWESGEGKGNKFIEALTDAYINVKVAPQMEKLMHKIASDYGVEIYDRKEIKKFLENNPNSFIQEAIEQEHEMQAIKEKAIADGTFMKAPNGKPTNLNERQWLQVRTKNFINWFGDWVNDPANASKVVDENGEPLVVYRGDSNGKTQFNPTKPSYNAQGIYIAGNKTFASNYTKPSFYNNYTEGVLYEVFVNAKNPIYNSRDVEGWNNGKYDTNDSWIYGNFPNGNGELVVRNSNQIKSATDNIGTFSTENNDIQMAVENSNQKTTLNNYGTEQAPASSSTTQQAYWTENGELYGFLDSKANFYFDETVVSPEHYIHEYTHLWDRVVAKKNPKLWRRGIELMEHTSLWNEIANDSNYGLKWKAMKNMTDEKLKSLIASEVHSRFTGEGGEALLQAEAKKHGTTLLSKLKEWILAMWKDLKGTFTDFSDDELSKLTLKDFNHMTVRDLFAGTDLQKAPAIEDSNVDIQRENLRQERQKVEELETELGADERASEEVKDALKVAVVGLSFEEAIARQGSFFTEEEKGQIKKALDGKNLQVMSVSRETDPAFFSEEVVNFLKENAKKELSDPTRVQAMEIWSKHDGLPIKDILDACKKYRVAPMVSFSITGLGGTALEGGVMKYQDMLNKVGELVKNGTLNPVTTTIRIDPLLPGVTNMEDVKKIVATAKSFGIKKFVTSLMQSYGYTKNQWVYYGSGRKSFFDLENPKDVERLKKIDSSIADVKEIDGILTPVDTSGNRVFVKNLYSNDRKVIQGIDEAMTSEGKKYDWDKYYGRTYNGKIDFKPKQQYIDEIAKVLLELDKDPEITIQTCSFNIKGLKTSACLDPMIIERVVGTDVIRPDGTYIKDTSRKDCMCYGCHGDFFAGKNKKCYSSCAYCYAAHSGDNKLNYYNADGTLKDNPYTRTSRDSSTSPSQAAEAEQPAQNPYKVEIYAGHWTREEVEGQSDKVYLFGDNTDDRVNTHHVPISTQAVIRGLPNAIGIDTKKNRGVSADSYFTDADFDTFKTQVDYAIKKAKSSGKTIVIPEDGIGTGKAMLEKKAPRLFNYLQKELKKLQSQSLKQEEEENSQVFTPHTMELKNITEQEGDKTIYVDKKWKEEELKKLDDDLGRYNMFEEYREEVLQKIEKVKSAVDKVSLPNFEFKTNRYEATLIDAEWKIPLLKELEEQLTPLVQESQTETTEEQIEIIDQMDRILKAANKEELKNHVSEQKKTTQQELSDFDKIQNQFNNLLDSDVISASEIRHLAELIVNTISDDITSYQKDPSLVKKHFATLTLKDSFDIKKASREEIVKAIGINRLIKRAQDIFDPENGNYDDIDTILQADLIGKNWDALMILAADIFAKNEGFGIERNYKEGNFKTTKNTIIDYDDPDMQKKAEQAAEGEADEQEQWQIESKTIDIVYSMSELVRRALQQCYLYDSNGNKVVSKWGIPERVDARNAVNSILRWTNGSMSLEDMVTKLTTKAEQNPWLNQLIQRLSDTNGEETDFQSQFYGVFSKARQLYSIVKKDKNGYYSMIVNNHPALSEAMETITAQYKIGEHPLFQNGRVNIKYLGTKGGTGTSNEFTLHKALSQLQAIVKRLNSKEELNDEMIKEATANIAGVCRIFGFNVTEDMVTNVMTVDNIKDMTKFLKFMITDLEAGLQTQKEKGNDAYDPFEFKGTNSISGTLRNFLTPITDTLEDTAISAFYDSGKMYQTYITPSFMTRLFDKFNLEGQQFEDFIMDEYGFSEWFASSDGYDSQTKRWKNWWLNKLVKDPEARKAFAHKVELNFNGHNYMRNMSDAEYALSLLSEYWSENSDITKDMALAWYRVPMQSNKPSSDFIRFYSFRGEGYKDNITNRLYEVFLQELSRIQTVRMRNNDKNKNNIEPIKNFDSNGRQFNFIPELNDYLEGKEVSLLRDWYTENNPDAESSKEADMKLTSLLQDKLDGKELSENDEVKLKNLVKTAIRLITENKIKTILDKWQDSGIIEAAATIKGIVPKTYKDKEAINSHLRDAVENYLWNDHYASMMILQMTITDVSFYKDAEDLQKRLAQLHAPGTRGNKFALDYAGNKVSDGKYRTFILKDFDSFKSNIIDNIAEVFDRKIARAKSEAEIKSLKALKESLVGEDGRYKKINVADAQGFSSPSSYRKKAFIFGKWSKNAEEIYEKLLKGEYTYSDLETAFQPLKPFVYTHLHKNIGVGDTPITSLPVPFQAKNAEYLLIMADAIIKSEESVGGKLSQPNILRAIYRVMEDSAYDGRTYNEDGTIKEQGTYNGKGIDTVQFESAIKSGLQGKIDVHQFANMEGGEEAAYTYMRKLIYKDAEAAVKEYNIDSYVHEASFDDYCLQQEVPEHFRGHSQAHGSQIRMIIPSDLDFYKNPNGDKAAEDNKVYYEWTEVGADGKKVQKKMRADEFKREYENTIAENISQSIDNLADELHIKSTDIRERNIALSKILQREILSSPRYGVDLLQACSVDKETGNFRIPKGDPIQSKRIEQLINSIIKNRVNNQKIAGGPIVQVSNFGTSKSLHIRFKSKDGGLLMTKEEYEEHIKQAPQAPSSQIDKFNAKYAIATKTKPKTWKEYLKENQAGIAYFEVYAPIWSKEIFEKFSNVDGTIDVEAIEAVDPELLKMISYRIPTEDKYSCAPMKVVGFMPREAGDAIMLPQELTEIDDSDFDVDKRYVMRKDIPIRTRSEYAIKKELIKRVRESYKKTHTEKLPEKYLLSIEAFMKAPLEERGKDKFTEWLWNNYKRIAYYTVTPTSGKTYRDNKIVDMSWAVLTNEMTADKILNPGGFDDYKKLGYSILAYKNDKEDWDALEKMDTDYLKKLSYVKKDLTYADAQVQFYHQNVAGSNLIGVFAVNKVAHAVLESDDIYINVEEICGEKPFVIGSSKFSGKMKVDPTVDTEGNMVGKNVGSGVSASADTAKEPVLDLMNINMATAGVFNSLLRLGMSKTDAALFMSQDVISRALDAFNKENLTKYKSLNTIMTEMLHKLSEKHAIKEGSNINTQPLTREELIRGLKSDTHEEIDYKVLLAYQKASSIAQVIRDATYPTRFNSISNAVGPLIIDNLIMEHKIENFMLVNCKDGTHLYTFDGDPIDITDIFNNHPILQQFARTVNIAKELFKDMPTGSTGFRNLLHELPDGLSDTIYRDRKLLDSLANFYNSYLLVASGFVNSGQLYRYINNFPVEFIKQKIKEAYPDNALIQAIKLKTDKNKKAFLEINLTGEDTQYKELLSSAWIDLHKANPELSTKLFMYNFFRAGINFSPKTFMALVPTYVKERLVTKLSGDSKISYTDVYRLFPSVNNDEVIDQFVRNNWNNNKLVPWRDKKDIKYEIDWVTGRLSITDKNSKKSVNGLSWMKTKETDKKTGEQITCLWKLMVNDERSAEFVKVDPLGNNGEYLEISTSHIGEAMVRTTESEVEKEISDISEQSPVEDEADAPVENPVSEEEQVINLERFAEAIMQQRESVGKPVTREGAENIIAEAKKNPKLYGAYLANVFETLGVQLDKEQATKKFKEIC